MKEIHLIGIGDEGQQGLLPEHVQRIENAELLIGGERHLSFFPEFLGEKWVITGALSDLVKKIQFEQGKREIVILASGDPLFYGIGSYLFQKIQGIKIYPYLSSIQLAFSRIGLGWQDAFITSLHGRPIKGFIQRIDGKEKIAILTDSINTPAAIGKYILNFGMNEYSAFVGENLGSSEEKCGWYKLEELQDQVFSPLNVLILVQNKGTTTRNWKLGIDDEQFVQRKPDKGLITKREVRVLSLSELNLKSDSIVWDIGTCTASVAIEAAKLAPLGQVYAIEKNEGDIENARENCKKFRTDITLVHGKAPEGLEDWPDPNAVFIGGSGGEMEEVLRICTERLRPDGRIVLNAATIETLYEATSAFTSFGFQYRVTLMQTARSKPILNMTRFEGLNPIYIITAWKPEGWHTNE